MKKTFFWSLLFGTLFCHTTFAQEFKRLDPHGDATLKWGNQCTVCHVQNSKKNAPLNKQNWSLKHAPAATCINCHNPNPHSGTAEHVGKINTTGQQREIMTCLSCHYAHRSDSAHGLDSINKKPGSKVPPLHERFFSPSVSAPVPKGFKKASSPETSMLRRTCTECHKW